jgi:hypothetical protein
MARAAGSERVWTAIHRGFVGLFAGGALVHVWLALRSPETYRVFADQALFGWVSARWQDVFMADPRLWALLLAAGELTVAILLVVVRRWGYVAVIAFHLALMLFGWGFWLWSVPVLCVAVPAALREFRLARQASWRSGRKRRVR